jgi:hypothetical protein
MKGDLLDDEISALPASSLCCDSVASTNASESVERFLQRFTTSESDQAVDQLFAGSGFSESKPQDIVMLKSQIRTAVGLYGTPIGLEKIREEDFSPSLKRLVYLQKFDKTPVAWEFYFYKPKDKWVINTLSFKDQVGSLVDAKQ